MSNLTVTPVVDGLFSIANDHTHLVVGQGVVNQGKQVLPLQYGGVLELVDKDMFEMFPEPFVDERHGEVPHYLVDALVEFRDMNNLFLADIGFQFTFESRTQDIEAELVKLAFVEQIGANLFLVVTGELTEYGLEIIA